jgi:hypothetical protein
MGWGGRIGACALRGVFKIISTCSSLKVLDILEVGGGLRINIMQLISMKMQQIMIKCTKFYIK